MKEKVDPYLRPLYDALYELFGADKIDKKIESGEIEIAPLAFMRGRTLKNCFAILDEASSKIAKQFFKVLPLINANGAISISPDSIFLSILSAPNSSYKAS